jgi:hypothetical protein
VRVRAGVAIVFTLALHLVWWWALRSPPVRLTPPAAASRVTLRLVPPQVVVQAARPEVPAPARADKPRLSRTPLPTVPPKPTLRVPGAEPSVAAHEPAASSPAPQRPLELAVPQRPASSPQPSTRDQAMLDPRANSPRPTPSERFAQTLGSDETLIEESRGEGRIRVKRGRTCLDVRVARNAELDPYSMSYRPTPKVVEDCNRR